MDRSVLVLIGQLMTINEMRYCLIWNYWKQSLFPRPRPSLVVPHPLTEKGGLESG